MEPVRHRSAFLATALSFVVPGLGQLHNGDRAKGIAILCITVGIWFWVAMATVGPEYFRSVFTQVVLAVTYLFVLIPAVTDAYRGASGPAQSVISSGKPWYVILMVLMTGAMAVPLVWQSPCFSRTGRVIWSVIGILNTLLALLVLAVVGPMFDRWLAALSKLLTILQ